MPNRLLVSWAALIAGAMMIFTAGVNCGDAMHMKALINAPVDQTMSDLNRRMTENFPKQLDEDVGTMITLGIIGGLLQAFGIYLTARIVREDSTAYKAGYGKALWDTGKRK